jgi:cullin-associated NEDD8-dissociated protein 1
VNVRKRASYCMGAFAQILSGKQLQQLTTILVDKINKGSNKSDKVIQVACLSLMAKSVGNKLAPYLQQIIPLLSKLMQQINMDQSNDTDNELSEACLTTMQSIIHKCPAELKNNVNDLFKASMSLSQYDPNYMYADEDEDMGDGGDDEGWGSDFDDDNQDAEQDDDDTSWKVRRGAYRVIDAIISTRPDLHTEIIKDKGAKLAELFRERVDDVKCDLLDAFRVLVTVDENNNS